MGKITHAEVNRELRPAICGRGQSAGPPNRCEKVPLQRTNIYPRNVLEAAADGFDFSQENAEVTLSRKLRGRLAGSGLYPKKRNPKTKATFDALRAELDAQETD